MKKSVILFLYFLLSSYLFLSGKTDLLPQKIKENVINSSPGGFIENRGQMKDMNGNRVDGVLFMAEFRGLYLWITQNGVTMLTTKIETGKNNDNYFKNFSDPFSHHREIKNLEKILWERIEIELIGGNIRKSNIIKEDAGAESYNFFYPHCPEGILGVKKYKKIIIKDVYPGIDWVWYSDQFRGYKYEFVVHPGSDYSQIQLVYKTKNPLKINPTGELEILTEYGKLKEQKPISFNNHHEIITSFKIKSQKVFKIHNDNGYKTSICFQINSSFNLNSDLIIDPQLVWGTFFGGSGVDGARSIGTDNSDNIILVGHSGSVDFPVLNSNAFFQGSLASSGDAIISKFNNNGTLIWSTYYGGSDVDAAESISTDNNGNIFVVGITNSSNFPLHNSGTFFQGTYSGGVFNYEYDIFILKFNNIGNRLWATYYGGNDNEFFPKITIDNNGNIIMVGCTYSTNFPTQNSFGAFFQSNHSGFEDAFIVKFDNFGNRIWATYYGGSAGDGACSVDTDASGNIFVVGYTNSPDFNLLNSGTYFQGNPLSYDTDGFILKFSSSGNLLWGTRYGGSTIDHINEIIVDQTGNIFVCGSTFSNDLPVLNSGTFFQGVKNGSWDVFLVKFDNNGNRLWATYYGDNSQDLVLIYSNNISSDKCGNIYISLMTLSSQFLSLTNYCNAAYYDSTGTTNNGIYDGFLTMFSNNGDLLWNSFIGGGGYDDHVPITTDSKNNLIVTLSITHHSTYPVFSTDYPLHNPGNGAYFDQTFDGVSDILLAKFSVFQEINKEQSNTNCSCNGVASLTVCGLPPFSYKWSNGQQVLNTTVTTNSVGGLCAGVHHCTVSTNCKDTVITFTITNPAPSFSATVNSNSLLCYGFSNGSAAVSLTGGIAPVTYSWNNGATTPSVSGLSYGTYTVVITDGNNCSEVHTISVDAPPQLSVSIGQSPNIVCEGQTTTLTASAAGGVGGYSYQWNGVHSASDFTISEAAGTYIYTLSVSDSNNCLITETVAVIFKEIPSISLSNYTICAGQQSVLTAYGAFNYTWYPSGITGSTIHTNSFTQSINPIYVLGISANGCTASASASLVINPLPNALIKTNDIYRCAPSCITFTAVSTENVISYNWHFGSQNPIGSSSVQSFCFDKAGTYSVYVNVTNDKNCSNITPPYVINIFPKPNADFYYKPEFPIIDEDNFVNFTDASSGASIVGWNWFFHSNSQFQSQIQSPGFLFTEAGLFPVTLLVTSDKGCKDTITKIIRVYEDASIYIPNAFTPNGDGLNDVFQPKGRGILEYEMMIYNRWGEKLFETHDFNIGWDGFYKGEICKDDIYAWRIKFKNIKGKVTIKTGHVTLMK